MGASFSQSRNPYGLRDRGPSNNFVVAGQCSQQALRWGSHWPVIDKLGWNPVHFSAQVDHSLSCISIWKLLFQLLQIHKHECLKLMDLEVWDDLRTFESRGHCRFDFLHPGVNVTLCRFVTGEFFQRVEVDHRRNELMAAQPTNLVLYGFAEAVKSHHALITSTQWKGFGKYSKLS